MPAGRRRCPSSSSSISASSSGSTIARLQQETELEDRASGRQECLHKPAYQEWFPWEFRTERSRDCPTIKLVLIEDVNMTKWEMRIQALRDDGGLPENLGPLTRIVSEPGERELIGRTPRSEEFPNKVSEWLKARFLLPDSGRELQRIMKAVAPLGECRVLSNRGLPKDVDEAEGTLQLDWTKYQYLSQSVFTVVCREDDQTWIELGSEGRQKARPV